MEYRILGKTGISVSRICYGSLTLGPLQRNFSPEYSDKLLRHAYSRGINFVDSAQYYRNYSHIAPSLPGSRDIVISSKTYAYTAEQARAAVDEARESLGRDYIDIFMLHEQESIHTLRGHMEALEELYRLKSLGIIRAVGASTHRVAGVLGVLELGLDVLHPLINVEGLGIGDGTRQDMEAAISAAHDKGIGVYAMKAIGGGNLYTRASECLNYAFSLPFADSIAIGMQSVSEIDGNINFLEQGDFGEYKSELSAISRELIVEEHCTGCGACVNRCMQKALRLEDNRIIWDRQSCLFCGYCGGVCPNLAIKVI